MKKAAILIILAGLLIAIFTVAPFSISKKVVKIGKVEITADKRYHLKWSPVIGIAVMGIGGAVFWWASKK